MIGHNPWEIEIIHQVMDANQGWSVHQAIKTIHAMEPVSVQWNNRLPIGIAAGAALVAAQNNFIYGDLDSIMFFEEHPGIRGGFEQEGSVYKLNQGNGLGVEVDF